MSEGKGPRGREDRCSKCGRLCYTVGFVTRCEKCDQPVLGCWCDPLVKDTSPERERKPRPFERRPWMR